MFDTWSYESEQPFSLKALREMVRKKLPASIYRCKGIVFVAEKPDKRIALQIVGRRTEISELDEWGDRTPRTQIVAIGAPIIADELSNQFDACIVRDSRIAQVVPRAC
jgi:G3E family GTPase